MMEVVKQVGILHPYTVEVYVAVDGSEVCLSLTPPKAFCAQDDSMREVKLELAFSRYETRRIRQERCTDQRAYWHTPRRRGST
jgi:hypothetical protein